jgi:hypothetical protein
MALTVKQKERLDVLRVAYGPQTYQIPLSPEQSLELILNGRTDIVLSGTGTIQIIIKPASETQPVV